MLLSLIVLAATGFFVRRLRQRIDVLEQRVELLESLGEGRYSWSKNRTPPSQ